MSSFAALAWQNQAYKKISHKMRLHTQEEEEIQLLKLKADRLRDIRKKFLTEKWD